MIESDWNQERPTSSEIQNLWDSVVFEEVPFMNEASEKLLAELNKTHLNGDAKLVRCKFINHPVLHWFVSRNRFDEISFFEKFLKCKYLEILELNILLREKVWSGNGLAHMY